MNTIKGVIFDFNGTLFWDTPKHELAWFEMATRLRGAPLSSTDMKEHIHGQINTAIISYFLDKPCSAAEAKPYSLEKEAIYRDLCAQDPNFLQLAPGAIALFEWLKSHHIPQSIATASIKENVDFFIKTFHLDTWFPKTHITYDDGINKDKTEMFLKAAKAMDIPISSCLVIEDSVSGITFAKKVNAGMIIAIATKEQASFYENLPGVHHVIHDFQDFEKTIF